MCIDKDGELWTELHATCKELILGMAIGQVSYCAPRELWQAMPGGMPYIQVNQVS